MQELIYISPKCIGNPKKASHIFVGEAPGASEVLRKEPFCGRSGKLLRNAIEAAGIKNYWLVNVVPVRPDNNRTPSRKEIESWIEYLSKILFIIDNNKKMRIVSVGKVAKEALGFLKVKNENIYHPSYILRNRTKQLDWEKCFEKFV